LSGIKECFFKKPPEDLSQQIFVTDTQGIVLASNYVTPLTMGMSMTEFVGASICDLVQKGYYNKSYATEAIHRGCSLSGQIVTRLNLKPFTRSTPIFDENNNLVMVITYGRLSDVTDLQKMEELNNSLGESQDFFIHDRGESLIVAESKAMKEVMGKAYKVAQTELPVLLTGETGAGKDVVAKYIHQESRRKNGPFVAINCAALPEQLAESELFGYEKGAFTGAKAEGKLGLFKAADEGTIFLDEIGELPLTIQSKLLRVLEASEFYRLGDSKVCKTNARILTATNKNLKKMVEEGLFREDLYYRLNVFSIDIPPLRERLEDIIALSFVFLNEFNRKYEAKTEFSLSLLRSFLSYNWPGNVRELRNTIEKMVVEQSLNQNFRCSSEELNYEQNAVEQKESLSYRLFEFVWPNGELDKVMQNIEKEYIRYIIQKCGGNKSKAAAALGISRSMLYRKLNQS